jgi:hypothetical protein
MTNVIRQLPEIDATLRVVRQSDLSLDANCDRRSGLLDLSRLTPNNRR